MCAKKCEIIVFGVKTGTYHVKKSDEYVGTLKSGNRDGIVISAQSGDTISMNSAACYGATGTICYKFSNIDGMLRLDICVAQEVVAENSRKDPNNVVFEIQSHGETRYTHDFSRQIGMTVSVCVKNYDVLIIRTGHSNLHIREQIPNSFAKVLQSN